MTCSNCNARLSCGCQRKTASDGKACCSNCIAAYENKLPPRVQAKPALGKFTTHANPSVWGANRYVQTTKK
jgi:hypothetical protein